MYLSHFGLSEKPFSITPDPDFLYSSESHTSALATLEYGIFEQAGITVLTGEIGAGKTTLLRHLLLRIPYDEVAIGLVSNIHESLGDFLQWVALAFELDCDGMTNAQIFRALQNYIVEEYASGKKVVLIMDEAQNMGMRSLEELRMLSNINAEKDELLHIVLIGQPELQEMLNVPQLRQLAQRVTSEFHLQSLSAEQTSEYINHRMELAGGNADVFTPDACAAIYEYSNGVPRLINVIADQSLALAYGESADDVSREIVDQVVSNRRIGALYKKDQCASAELNGE